MTTRDRAEFSDVLLVSNAAVLEQAGCSIQFTNISDAGLTDLMEKSRNVALHAAHMVSTEHSDLT